LLRRDVRRGSANVGGSLHDQYFVVSAGPTTVCYYADTLDSAAAAAAVLSASLLIRFSFVIHHYSLER